MKRLPVKCPSCEGRLNVKSLICESCETQVTGEFLLPVLAGLAPDEQQFIVDFVKNSGSLKIMAQKLKLSYPTVRNRLDEIIKTIEENEKKHGHE